MRIRKYLHSCLLIEKKDNRLLIDPGIFSFIEGTVDPAVFEYISVIAITHQHDDHMDLEMVRSIADKTQCSVITNNETAMILQNQGIRAIIAEEKEFGIGGFTIRGIPALHEQVLSQTPENTAYIINDTILHPGDSLDEQLFRFKGIPVLALPVMAPWATVVQIVEFAERMAPKIIIPIHDGYAKDFFLERQYRNFNAYFAGRNIQFRPLKTEEVLEV